MAKDRVISIVDPEYRLDHKTSAHGFDDFEGHVAIDPDAEITAVVVAQGNTGETSLRR